MWPFDWVARYYVCMGIKDVHGLYHIGERPEQVNLIKMRIQGIWDCPNQDQEVGAKHINETEMFQMTSGEPMEPIDEEVGDLGNLENVSEFEQTQQSADHTEKEKGDNPDQSASPV